jgi:hypothetical protein
MGFECGVSVDRQTAIISVDREMGAADLEKLTENLMACRAELEPRRRSVMFPGSRILMGAGLHVQAGEDGQILVAVHHAGLGWVGCCIERRKLVSVIARTQAHAAESDPG